MQVRQLTEIKEKEKKEIVRTFESFEFYNSHKSAFESGVRAGNIVATTESI